MSSAKFGGFKFNKTLTMWTLLVVADYNESLSLGIAIGFFTNVWLLKKNKINKMLPNSSKPDQLIHIPFVPIFM